MNKRLVFAITIIIVTCLCMTVASGCLAALHISKDFADGGGPLFGGSPERQETLKLADVKQSANGELTFKIENEGVIKRLDTVEISLNGGSTWHEAKENNRLGRYYEPLTEYYGKTCYVAVRIAGDGEKKAGKKSNTVKYKVKKPSDFKGNISSEFLSALFYLEPKENDYVFVAQDGRLILKKYRFTPDGDLVADSLTESEMLNFEYIIIDAETAIKEYRQTVESLFNGEEIKEDPNYSKFVDTMSVLYYLLTMSNEEDLQGWTDYDYSRGISKAEYEKGVVWNFDYSVFNDESQNPQLIHSGNMVMIYIRDKGGSSTLCSNVGLAGVFIE